MGPPELALLALILAGAVMAVRRPVLGIVDALWHVQTGRLLLDAGELFRTEPFSFTATGKPVVLQSWSIDAVYGMADRASETGAGLRLVVAVTVFGALLFLAGTTWARAGRHGATSVLLMVPIFVATTAHFTLRPDIVSLVLLVATAAVGLGWRGRPWHAFPLFVVWANVHGLFLLGLGYLLLIALVCQLRQPLRLPGTRPPSAAWWTLGWGALGSLVNPYGPRLHLAGLALTGQARLHISEWLPPTTAEAKTYALIFCTILIWAAVGTSARALPAEDLAVAGTALILAWTSRRLVAPGVVVAAAVAAPWIAAELRAREPWGPRRGRPLSPSATRRVNVIGVTILMVVSATLMGAEIVGPAPKFAEDTPLAAIDALPPGARVAAHDTWAPVITYRRWPEVRTAFDGRIDVFGRDHIQEMSSLLDGRGEPVAVLERIDATHVLVPEDSALGNVLRVDPGWTTLAEPDPGAELFQRR